LRFAHEAMGTTFELLIAGEDESYCREVSQAVFAEVDRMEALLSRFNPCSELGQLNRLPPGRSMVIGVETYECLKTAQWTWEQTGGAFDVNVRAKAAAGGGEKVSGDTPGDRSWELRLKRSREMYMVEVLGEPAGSAPALDLDLGGIGKGYALDRTVDILRDWGAGPALVHGGTSTALGLGSPPGPGEQQGWPVGVGSDWGCGGLPREIRLRDRALSGSGPEVKGAHILDPRSGDPASGHLAAWVSHGSAAVADALSTAFVVMGPGEVKKFCRDHPDVWALVVTVNGECRVFNRDALD